MGGSLQSWGTSRVVQNLYLLREKLEAGGSLLTVGHCAGGGVYSKNLSQPFLSRPACWSYSASFWISLRELLHVLLSTFSEFMGGGKFKEPLTVSNLVPESQFI